MKKTTKDFFTCSRTIEWIINRRNATKEIYQAKVDTLRGKDRKFSGVLIRQEFPWIIESDSPSPLTFLQTTFLFLGSLAPQTPQGSLLFPANRNGCRFAIFPFENILRKMKALLSEFLEPGDCGGWKILMTSGTELTMHRDEFFSRLCLLIIFRLPDF